MRNLKRALSLALASVMVLGLMIVGSSAKTSQFADADTVSEDYKEAIDVLTTIGVLEGVEDGTNFDPQGTLTREMAAKVLSVMILGKDNADRLGTNAQIFKDVAAGRWSAGYIAYCSETGIIAGDGAGNFDPEGKLTGVAFGKMLLTALGYDAAVEGYVNTPSWAINVSSDMVETGVDVDGIKLSDPITREQAAQMALNAIKTPMVEYGSRTEVSVNGADIVVGGNEAKYVTTTLAQAQRISTRTLSNSKDYTVEFGEKYMPNLWLHNDNIQDAFGRPAATWVYQTEDIGTYVRNDLLVKEFKDTVKSRDVYAVIGIGALNDYNLVVYEDGANVTGTTATTITPASLKANNSNDLTPTGKGVLTQVFMDHELEKVSVVIVNTYLAKVNADYNASTKTLPITVYHGFNDKTGTSLVKSARLDLKDFADLADYSENDILKVTMAIEDHDASANKYNEYTIESIALAEIIPDVVVSNYTNKNVSTNPTLKHLTSVTADGTKYDASEKAYYDPELLLHYENTMDKLKDSTYNLYMDDYGNVLGLKEVSVTDNYIFVVGYEAGSSVLAKSIDKALIIHTDGSMEAVQIKDDKLQTWNNSTHKWADGVVSANVANTAIGKDPAVNKWYTYTMEGDIYVLKREVLNQGRDHSMDRSASGADISGTYADLETYNPYTSSSTDRTIDAVYGNADSVYIAVKADKSVNGNGSIVSVNGVSTGIKNTNIVVDDVNSTYVGTAASFGNTWRGKTVMNHGASAVSAPADTFFIYNNKGYVTYAVVVGEDEGNSNNMLFFATGAKDRGYDSQIGKYYVTYDVISGGKLVTIRVDDDCATAAKPVKGDLWKANINKDGWVTALTDGTGAVKAYGNSKDMNTTANKAAKYTQTSGTFASPVKLTLNGATLWVTEEKSDDNYVVITDECKVFVKVYDSNNYEEFGSIEAALAALTTDVNSSGAPIYAYVSRVTTVCDGTTGYATTLVITENKVTTTDSTIGQGTKGNVTYKANNLNGYAVLNYTVTAPEYAAYDSTVTYSFDILVNGVVFDTITRGTTPTPFTPNSSNNGIETGQWSHYVFDPDAVITISEPKISVDKVAIKWVNGDNGETLYLKNWAGEQANTHVLSALSGPSKFTYLEVNTASPIGAIFSTDDNSKDLTFTAIGLKTKDQSGKWLGADFAVGKALTNADTAKGDQFVVVTLDGISKLEQKWDIKLDKTAITDTEAQKVFQYYNGSSDENTTATAQKLGDLGITGIDTAEDSKIEVSFSQYKDIPTGNAVKMSFKFTGTGSATAKAASYDVSITIGGKTYLFADLNALNTSATTYDRWIENVNRDLMITSISVKVNKPLLAVENVSFTNDNKTMIVKFNQPIQHKDGSGHSLASSDFSLTSGGLQVVRMDISGDTVTIVYDKPIVSTNTLTITTNVAARDNVKNVLKNPVIVNISTDTDGSLKATFA